MSKYKIFTLGPGLPPENQTDRSVSEWKTIRIALFFGVLSLTAGVTLWIFNLIYSVQPTPFLDEVFHIPQAIQYCEGNFSYWNPKITTLPGLYGISFGFLVPLGKILQFPSICTVYTLRLTNFVAFVANFYLLYDLHKRIHDKSRVPDFSILLSSLNLATFPVLYFFTFLYYTDSVSTALVLLMYDLNFTKHMKSAALTGVAACMVRQTNIIWVGFLMLEAFPEVLVRQEFVARYRKEMMLKKNTLSYFKVLIKCLKQTKMSGGFPAFIKLVYEYLSGVRNYMLVCILFLVFIVFNGGIVIGDRSAHQPAVHLIQICYFATFTVGMAAPYFVTEVVPFVKTAANNVKFVSTTWAVMAVIVHKFTIEHPYLLADNRHYVFYLWHRVFRSHYLMRYILIFGYIFAVTEAVRKLKNTNLTFRLHFIVCLALVLVPQSLLEFRYFIIPYLLYRLNIVPTNKQLIGEFCWYSLINAVTVYLFVTKTFYWPDSEEKQRIIW